MKISMALALILSSIGATAHAGDHLACWNLWDKFGAKPAFIATIDDNTHLSEIKMLVSDGVFGPFDISDVVRESAGEEITSSRSPYQGATSFQLTPDADIRIILPADLSIQGLKKTSFDAGNISPDMAARQNGVIEVAGNRHGSGGSIFIRMHCTAKAE